MIRIWLDDVREAPEGWVRTYTAPQTIGLLQLGNVEAMSLDHDLGLRPEAGNGHDVLVWLEERVALGEMKAPADIRVHSANPVAVDRMEKAIESIRALERINEEGRRT